MACKSHKVCGYLCTRVSEIPTVQYGQTGPKTGRELAPVGVAGRLELPPCGATMLGEAGRGAGAGGGVRTGTSSKVAGAGLAAVASKTSEALA